MDFFCDFGSAVQINPTGITTGGCSATYTLDNNVWILDY